MKLNMRACNHQVVECVALGGREGVECGGQATPAHQSAPEAGRPVTQLSAMTACCARLLSGLCLCKGQSKNRTRSSPVLNIWVIIVGG